VSLRVINDNTGQMFPVAEPLNGRLQIFMGGLPEIGIDLVRETLSQHLCSVFEIPAQTQPLRSHLVVSREQRDQGDPHNQRDGKTKRKEAHK